MTTVRRFFLRYYWGCYGCGKEIPEPQVYCSDACRREMEG